METVAKIVKSTAFIYSVWVVLHYVCPHLYVEYCVPNTIKGFAMSVIMAPAPHCKILRWGISTGADMINMMWLWIAASAVQLLVPDKMKKE